MNIFGASHPSLQADICNHKGCVLPLGTCIHHRHRKHTTQEITRGKKTVSKQTSRMYQPPEARKFSCDTHHLQAESLQLNLCMRGELNLLHLPTPKIRHQQEGPTWTWLKTTELAQALLPSTNSGLQPNQWSAFQLKCWLPFQLPFPESIISSFQGMARGSLHWGIHIFGAKGTIQSNKLNNLFLKTLISESSRQPQTH